MSEIRKEHNVTCKMVFGRPSKHGDCPRCEELKTGAKPRTWNMSYNYQMKVGKGPDYERFKQALESHNCVKSNCGPVCTAFEW